MNISIFTFVASIHQIKYYMTQFVYNSLVMRIKTYAEQYLSSLTEVE